MRPGPGLVVMALAFISGARRGSTSSISSKTTTTSSPPTPPPPPTTTQILTKTTPALSSTLFQTTVAASPTASTSSSIISSTRITTSTLPTIGDSVTTTSSPPIQSLDIYESFDSFDSSLFQEDEYHSIRSKKTVPFNFLNTFFTRNTYSSYPSASNSFSSTYPLPSHLTQHYDDPRTRTESNTVSHSAKQARRASKQFPGLRKRRTRSVGIDYRGSGTGNDDSNENLNDSDDTLTTVVDSSSDSALSDQTTIARGLLVHFPSLTAASDTSRSLDEDDIFALVAEDDLLSEESFDHLVKLTNDKIGDTNEEDYSSGTETVVESSSGSGAPDNVHDTTDQQNAFEDFEQQEFQHQQQQAQDDQKNEQNTKTQLQGDDVDADDGDKVKSTKDHVSDVSIVTIYTAHLVGNSNEKGISIDETDSLYPSDPKTIGGGEKIVTTTAATHSKADLDSPNKYYSILGSHFALTRLNPWISACDLAQPGLSFAPDLRGKCSAGTLPVAWVDEGPGPPTRLNSCKEITPFTNKLNKDNMINSLKNNNKNDNKFNKLVGYTTTTNTFNIKLRNSQPTISHSMNTNNNNNKNNNKNKNKNIDNKYKTKLLNPFNYYEINNNNEKMTQIRRNSKEASVATADHSDVDSLKLTTTNDTQTGNSSLTSVLSQQSRENYQQLHDMLMQQNEQAATSIQNLNNNNIVKMQLAASNYNDNNNNNNQFELKYNHNGNSNMNRNKRYKSNNINNNNNNQKHFDPFPTLSPAAIVNRAVTANNLNNDQYLKIPPPEKEQQQCLEYLGDSEATMPTQLCHLPTPSERLAQLRHLRLLNCYERNVYSALHALALNVTISGGAECLRVLQDLMDLDALASRITCGLSEILFRFDCRQVYSIVHQCDACKEAYRRWVCSTLVPYFAETSNILKPPQVLIASMKSSSLAGENNSDGVSSPMQANLLRKRSESRNNNNNTSTDPNKTTSHITAPSPNINSYNNNNNGIDMTSAMSPTKTVTSNFIANSNNNNNNNIEEHIQYNANNYHKHSFMQQEEQLHNVKKRDTPKQQKHQHVTHKLSNNNTSSSKSNSPINDINYKTIFIHHKTQPQHHSSSQALKIYDINPWTTIPRNLLISTARQQSSNATNGATALEHNFDNKSTKKRRKRSDNSTAATTTFADVFLNKPSKSISSLPSSSFASSMDGQTQKQQQEQKTFNFISTANNEDSFYVQNPVITKLLKRSKRKEFEFRKRRRIRPCLSVCQTVEQKCPYLLPADRAPAIPTQYAGEPTFLCLDYNVGETEEQKKKATHGPNECCYTYCKNSADGICTYCDDMWDQTELEKEAEVLGEKRETKLFNITMKTKGRNENTATIRVESKIQQKMGEKTNGLKMSTVAITVLNNTALQNATRLADRLQYYAFCDGVFYYDDDESEDTPDYPQSENCQALPALHSRCTIPYYANNYMSSADMLGSYRKHNEAQKLLIWLSTLLCLWSCYSARSMRLRRYNEDRRQQQSKQQQLHTHQQLKQKSTNTAYASDNICQSCRTREIMQKERNSEKIIQLWFDDKQCRILIIYRLAAEKATQTTIANKKFSKENYLLVKNFRHILRSTSINRNLKILEIPLLILLTNYKEILLLLFKKRQKLRKRKTKNFPRSTIVSGGKPWTDSRYLRYKKMNSKPKKFSSKYKIHYYNNYYYYCSCSQIFNCSRNANIINTYNSQNYKYIKKFQYNFSNCNFKSHTNYNNKAPQNNNKMMIIEIISLIKFSNTTSEAAAAATAAATTATTTHIIIINSYNNSNKTNYYYNIITIIIVSYNINKNSSKKENFNKFSLTSDNSHHRPQDHHYYYYHYYYYYYKCYNYTDYYYNYCHNNYNYFKIKFKPNNHMFNNKPVSLPTSTLTFSNTLNEMLMTRSIVQIMTLTIMTNLLFMLIMPLLFKSFLQIKYNNNNNYHIKNIKFKSKHSLSPNTSFNSKKTIYRLFYFYNFNINDWWQRRRWCWWRQRHRPFTTQCIVELIYHYPTEPSMLNDVNSQAEFFHHILL